MNCPKCGEKIEDNNVTHCPHCGQRIPLARTIGVPLAGALTIAGAGVSLLAGISGIGISLTEEQFLLGIPAWWILFAGVLSLIGFVFGLIGGTALLVWKRQDLAMFGTSWVLCSGLVTILIFSLAKYLTPQFGLVLGLPVIIVSSLGMALLFASRNRDVPTLPKPPD
jgi:hypothetical protein